MDEPKLEDMTLRDLIAMFAMQCQGELVTKPYNNLATVAETAYAMADAMIKKRNPK